MKNKILSKSTILILSIIAGLTVANNYYAQPMINNIALDFNVAPEDVGYISGLSLLGYGCGLFFLIPLGDKFKSKYLITILLSLLVVALVLMGLSPNITTLMISSFFVGMFAVGAQVLPPIVTKVDPDNRDKNLSTLVLGMLMGILLSRVFSGYLAQTLGTQGWRYVYLISAAIIFLMIFVIRIVIPDVPQQFSGNYGQLLKSTINQFAKHRMLRQTCLIGGLCFGVFNGFWTSSSIQLKSIFAYNSKEIGMFGLVAALGGLISKPFINYLTKRNVKFIIVLICALGFVLSILCVCLFPKMLAAYIATAIGISLFLQVIHVINLSRIFSLDPKYVGQLNTVYLFCYFIGGFLGTLICGKAMKLGGWELTTKTMMLILMFVLIIIFSKKYYRRLTLVVIKGLKVK